MGLLLQSNTQLPKEEATPPWPHRRWVTIVIALLIGVISMQILGTHTKNTVGLVSASYDWSHRLLQPFQSFNGNGGVVIVYIDLPSHDSLKQNPLEPWSRALHAKLLDRLTRAGARAVVLDVIFGSPGTSATNDALLEAAIRRNQRVILASELNRSPHQSGVGDRVEQKSYIEPLQRFQDAAAEYGLAELQIDEDFTVRRHWDGYPSDRKPSLPRVTAEFLGVPPPPDPSEVRWIRYYGPPMQLPSIGYATALDSAPEADIMFKDRVVFVGSQPVAGKFMDRRDELRNPLVPSTDRSSFMPAVEVLATQVLNSIRGDSLHRWPLRAEIALLWATALAFVFGLFRMKLPTAAVVTLILLPVGVATYCVAFAQWNYWFPWLIPLGFQLPASLLAHTFVESVIWYHAKITHAKFRKRATQHMELQAGLLSLTGDAILVQDLKGYVSYMNPAAVQLYGWTLEEVQSKGLPSTAISASEVDRQLAHELLVGRHTWSGELEQVTRTGRRIIVQSRWTWVEQDINQQNAIMMVNTDHTEKKRLEARFLQAQRMEAVGAIAGGMAHDLNNALAPVLLGVEMLRRQPHSEDAGQMLEAMEANARRGTDMVRQVLLFARGEDATTELVNVRQVVRETERMLRPMLPRSIQLSTLVPGDAWTIRSNVTRVCQVLVNLCLNARDAMPQGGSLTLAVDNVEMDEQEAASIRGGRTGAFVAFTVADSGVGIPPDNLERIFEPFYTTKERGKGTGLGLATVVHIVESCQGFIHVESEVGTGTTFQVFFPRADTSNQTEFIRAPQDPRPCVLVVGDGQALPSLFSSALEAHGFRSVHVPDTLEAQQHVRRIGHQRLAAVVIDSETPSADSESFFAELSRGSPEPRVVWLKSSQSNAPSLPPLQSAPVVLDRPVLPEALLEAIGRSGDSTFFHRSTTAPNTTAPPPQGVTPANPDK